MKTVAILFAIGFIVAACSKTELATTKPGTAIFTLIADPANAGHYSVNWMWVHNTSGQLLFYQSFQAGDTIKVTTTGDILDDKISVTLMSYNVLIDVTYKLKTYLQVPLGEVWTTTGEIDLYHPEIKRGTFSLTTADFPAQSEFAFTDYHGNAGQFASTPLHNGTFVTTCDLNAHTPNFLLTTRDVQDNLRYKYFQNVTPGASLSVAYSEMATPETILNVAIPQAFAAHLMVRSYDPDSTQFGYTIHNHFEDSPTRTSINIGYPALFQNFLTEFSVQEWQRIYRYRKVGSKPVAISLPVNTTVSITNINLDGFAFSSNSSFQRRESEWIYNGTTSAGDKINMEWLVYSPANGEQKIGTLPPLFASIYPELKPSALQHANTDFMLSGISYSDLIDATFKGKSLPPEEETYWISAF